MRDVTRLLLVTVRLRNLDFTSKCTLDLPKEEGILGVFSK